MLSEREAMEKVRAAWDRQYLWSSEPPEWADLAELALIAIRALQCGSAHPDRVSVRCTQLPHGNGHLYHRNSELSIEWWTSGDITHTTHDVLGPIQLGQPPAAASVSGPVSCPECRWIGQDGRDHDQLIGGWLRCAHCGHEWNGPESRPSTWCRAKHPHFDMYCDTLHHPLNTRRHGSSIYGVQWTDPQDPAESDQRGRYHTLPPCEDDPEPDDTVGVADRAVYRGLLPVLGEVSTFLNQMGQRYREGNPRMNAATCRTAEVHRDALNLVTDNLRGLLAVDGD